MSLFDKSLKQTRTLLALYWQRLWFGSPSLYRFARRAALIAIAALLLFYILDTLFPLPLDKRQQQYSAVIVARDGTPLRSFSDPGGVWRYPIKLDDVSSLYLQSLLNYEDRYYYHHFGINPGALVRAAWQRMRHGRIISGGSTITMQVARLIDPHSRTIPGKLKQMFRALQLEWHWNKTKILTYYVNHAPFGGTYEGVEAASRAYLGKSSKELSHADAALLAVLPQSPTRFRPDLNPALALKARNKVLDRMGKFSIWSRQTINQAKLESINNTINKHDVLAPLLARRLKQQALKTGILKTTIDLDLQSTIEQRLNTYISQLPQKTSIAVLVVENREMKTRAYAGSADFNSEDRFGHIDMIQAIRSPGSTLKPFLYGLAIEDGLVHSESLLTDAPVNYEGYQPANFQGNFRGPVSLSSALQHSLNIPAVQVLHHYGPRKFVARLENGGLSLTLPTHAKPNLSVILGGAGTNLEALVTAYSALARHGLSAAPRFSDKDPLIERRMLDPGAAWIIRRILEDHSRPGLPEHLLNWSHARNVAWKTGTSYGYRDAWAIGVTSRYTLGVWVGRPDGTPMPGHYGAITAAPILFDIVDSLPNRNQTSSNSLIVPANVKKLTICWPLGTPANNLDKNLCHQHQNAWTLNNTIPPTLPDVGTRYWHNRKIPFWVNPDTGLQVSAACTTKKRIKKYLAKWPQALIPWLTRDIQLKSQKPAVDPSCKQMTDNSNTSLKIRHLSEKNILRRVSIDKQLPKIQLEAIGGQGQLYWIINGKLAHVSKIRQTTQHRFNKTGSYTITVTDQKGNYDSVLVTVID